MSHESNDVQKWRKYHNSRARIIEDYKDYIDAEIYAHYYNTFLSEAFRVNDKESITNILSYIKDNNIRLSGYTKLKLLLNNLKLYKSVIKVKDCLFNKWEN